MHQFIDDLLPYMGKRWPLFRYKTIPPAGLEAIEPRLIHCGIALAIKAQFEPINDGDTIWFWNVCRDSGLETPDAGDAAARALGYLLIEDAQKLAHTMNKVSPTWLETSMHHLICLARRRLVLGEQVMWMLQFWKLRARVDLQWILVQAYRNQRGRYCTLDLATRWWENRIRRRYPNRMGDVFAQIYGPEHPFSRWMMGRI